MRKYLSKLPDPIKIFIRNYPLRLLNILYSIPFIPLILIIFLIRSKILIRIGSLYSDRIGHFAGNTELYLCELKAGINKPDSKFIDLFFLSGKISNQQLYKMWKRKLIILPKFLLFPIYDLTYILPGGYKNRVSGPSCRDRDVHNLIDKYPANLKFTKKEKQLGETILKSYGIKKKDKFICLNVRDSAFLSHQNYNYHSYRDCSINNYKYAAEKLADLGYFVIRMGAKVQKKLLSNNDKIIDYACDGKRSDFMDIFLGSRCYFSISTSTGWDCIPYIFRKPIVYAPIQPINNSFTFSKKFIAIFKHHIIIKENRKMTINEIFESDVFKFQTSNEFNEFGVRLIEPTKEEIWEVIKEMLFNLKNNFKKNNNKTFYQKKIIQNFSKYGNSNQIYHGEIKFMIGSKFIEQNF